MSFATKEICMNTQTERTGTPVFEAAWSAFLIIGSAVGTLAFACATPFAAVAAIAALTLPARAALITSLGVWLGNQAVGFLLLRYPLTADSLAWGPVLGASAILATAAAIRLSGGFERTDLRRWLVAFAAALVTQQVVVLAASLVDGTASLQIAAAVSGLNVVWFAVLAVIHRLLAGAVARPEPAPLTAR
jgi:hypothetical protein